MKFKRKKLSRSVKKRELRLTVQDTELVFKVEPPSLKSKLDAMQNDGLLPPEPPKIPKFDRETKAIVVEKGAVVYEENPEDPVYRQALRQYNVYFLILQGHKLLATDPDFEVTTERGDLTAEEYVEMLIEEYDAAGFDLNHFSQISEFISGVDAGRGKEIAEESGNFTPPVSVN